MASNIYLTRPTKKIWLPKLIDSQKSTLLHIHSQCFKTQIALSEYLVKVLIHSPNIPTLGNSQKNMDKTNTYLSDQILNQGWVKKQILGPLSN